MTKPLLLLRRSGRVVQLLLISAGLPVMGNGSFFGSVASFVHHRTTATRTTTHPTTSHQFELLSSLKDETEKTTTPFFVDIKSSLESSSSPSSSSSPPAPAPGIEVNVNPTSTTITTATASSTKIDNNDDNDNNDELSPDPNNNSKGLPWWWDAVWTLDIMKTGQQGAKITFGDSANVLRTNIEQIYGGFPSLDGCPLAEGEITDIADGTMFLGLQRYFENYGSPYKLCFGPKSFLVVSDPMQAKHILKDANTKYDKVRKWWWRRRRDVDPFMMSLPTSDGTECSLARSATNCVSFLFCHC